MSKLKIVSVLAAMALASSVAMAADKKPADKDMKKDMAAKPADKDMKKPDGKMPAAAPVMPKPAAELATLKVVAGTWKCKGQMTGMDGAMHDYTATYNIKLALDNFWYGITYVQNKAKGFPGFMGAGFMGYDGKQFVFVGEDNWGGMINLTMPSSAGATEFVWSGPVAAGGKMGPGKYTMSRKGDKEMHVMLEVGGKTAFDETCKR